MTSKQSASCSSELRNAELVLEQKKNYAQNTSSSSLARRDVQVGCKQELGLKSLKGEGS